MITRVIRSPLFRLTAGVTTVGGAAVTLNDQKATRDVKTLGKASLRISNLVTTASVMVADYTYCLYYKFVRELDAVSDCQTQLKQLQIDQKTHLHNYINATTSKEKAYWWDIVLTKRKVMNDLTERINSLYKQNRELFYSDLHHRNAIRLKRMCETNGGIYIKLGQHLAMLDHVVPREYREHLVSLLADTPTSSFQSVERIFQEDLSRKPLEIFDSFDPKPIASASLAQVHIATKNGQKFAVKVQHEGLRDGAAADLSVITQIVEVLAYYFRDFNYRWLTREMNLNLPLELNFLNEINNILQVGNDLQRMIATGDVAVPIPIQEYSSERILVMSFEEGYHLNNVKEMHNMHLQGLDVSTLVSKIFSEQIFRTGFVHCGKKKTLF
jgi:predicted unusual protein kinase regulating ubiquinone biosynthesis (AarF/ABC1/UbiB family)